MKARVNPVKSMTYSMEEGVQIASHAADDITYWLNLQPETFSIKNVEHDPEFQRRDIDLIWTTQTEQGRNEILVEIKGDRLDRTGNFFFETHSNLEKGTPGCFMYTEAHWLFYYFVNTGILYKLPMSKTRKWFLITMKRFRERSTITTVGSSYYTTVGRLVPIRTLMLEVPGVVMKNLREELRFGS
ncbi:hypothetical protein NIES267_37950 [Calothrix parasitica NIES-267]|uniref:DUF4365 domain-containing protein n=1 Tax=Calothrix parasitica NIES-267 TaxID=1973488 RepID=A0A1Z4LST0_9CYAN|nr:hypothetical protein NIES267_37950 [Calothrix parasitica NIES-267]